MIRAYVGGLAIMMNRQIGFKGWNKLHLKKTKCGDRFVWKKSNNTINKNTDRILYSIYIDRESWNQKMKV